MGSVVVGILIAYLNYLILSKILEESIDFNLQNGIVIIVLFMYFNYQIGSVQAIKICLFFELMLFVFIFDLLTKTIPAFVHWLIIGIGLIGIEGSWLLHQAIPGFLILSVPIFILNLFLPTNQKIGIGDIKLIGSCGFVIGLNSIFPACLFAFLSAWVIQKLISKQSDRKVSFSLGPYLSVSFLLFYF